MRLLDKYIIYSTVFSLFTEAFKFQYIIHWKLFYLILVINFFLLLGKNKITLNKNMFFLFLFLTAHATISFFVYQNPFTSFISQFLGISLSSIYFYSFFKNYGTKMVFEIYLNYSFLIATVAIPMFILNINSFDTTRLNGIMSEPAHYAAIMLPATYVFFKQKKFLKLSIILVTILLSKSFIGYLGFLLILILPLIKIKYLFKYFLLVIAILFFVVKYVASNWNNDFSSNNLESKIVTRVKQTYESLEVIESGVFKPNTNLSSYAIISNMFITRQNFKNNPLGTGLGSYRHQYDKYFENINPPEYLITLGLEKLNREDASSLFLRIVSDFGFFGFLIIIFFCFKGYDIMSKQNNIRQGTIFYLILKVIREGHYFPPEFYFFLLIFLKDFDKKTKSIGHNTVTI